MQKFLIALPWRVANSGATGVNDLPVAGQSRGVTDPRGDGGTALAVGEV